MYSFRSLFITPYLLLLIAGMMIPSDGSHGIFSIKSLVYISSVIGLTSYVLINGQITLEQTGKMIFFLAALIFLLLWAGISVLRDSTNPGSIYDQLKLLFLTLSVVLMSLYIAGEKLLSYEAFIKTIIYANFAYSVVKLLGIGLYLFGVVDLNSFLTRIGIRYMSMTIYGDVTRLQTSVDIVTPFLLYFVLQSKTLKVEFFPSFKSAFIAVSVLSIFFSFSRFLLAIAAFSFLLHWINLQPARKIGWLAVMTLLAMGIIFWIGLDKIHSAVEMRFFSRSAWTSDAVREMQINSLLAEFKENPILGKGIGSYSERVIRDKMNKHSYEVQWVAFLMQFGMLGLGILFIPVIYIGRQFFSKPFIFVKFSFFLMYLCWLIAGFFNPFLISLTSGIAYALFAWTALRIGNESFQSFDRLNYH